mgnify:CR=1 FL=1
MARRKRYIRGRVYLENDNIVVKNYKPSRRYVAVNNDRNNMHVKRITKIKNGGANARKGTPIERYSDIPLPSVVENKTFRHDINGNPIVESTFKRKTNTRLNKWDMKRISERNIKRKK